MLQSGAANRAYRETFPTPASKSTTAPLRHRYPVNTTIILPVATRRHHPKFSIIAPDSPDENIRRTPHPPAQGLLPWIRRIREEFLRRPACWPFVRWRADLSLKEVKVLSTPMFRRVVERNRVAARQVVQQPETNNRTSGILPASGCHTSTRDYPTTQPSHYLPAPYPSPSFNLFNLCHNPANSSHGAKIFLPAPPLRETIPSRSVQKLLNSVS